MPHLIVEYSANVEDRIDLEGLLDRLHVAASGYDVFPSGGLRVRAVRREHYRIADGHPANGFVHITAMIGHGRPLEVRKAVGQGLFQTICEQLDAPFRDSPLAISFNIQEFHPELNFKRNNLHEHVRARAADAASAVRAASAALDDSTAQAASAAPNDPQARADTGAGIQTGSVAQIDAGRRTEPAAPADARSRVEPAAPDGLAARTDAAQTGVRPRDGMPSQTAPAAEAGS